METLARRGDRFIAPFDIDAGLVAAQQRVPVRPQAQSEETVRKPFLQRNWVLGFGGAAMIVIAVVSYG